MLLSELAQSLSENQNLTQLKANQDEALVDTIIAEATQEIEADDTKEVETMSDNDSEYSDENEKDEQSNQTENENQTEDYDLVNSDFLQNDTLPMSNSAFNLHSEMLQVQQDIEQQTEQETENISKKRHRQ